MLLCPKMCICVYSYVLYVRNDLQYKYNHNQELHGLKETSLEYYKSKEASQK